jgi:hypothetical protein
MFSQNPAGLESSFSVRLLVARLKNGGVYRGVSNKQFAEAFLTVRSSTSLASEHLRMLALELIRTTAQRVHFIERLYQ